VTPAAWWSTAADRLTRAQRALLALDFDGTLAPLVDDPEDSRVLPAGAKALHALAQVPSLQLALVSGRPINDLARLALPPEGTHLAGSHGAEFGQVKDQHLCLIPQELSPAQQERLEQIEQGLEQLVVTAGKPAGAWVEHKPFAHVLHTRLVSDAGTAARISAEAEDLGRELQGHVLAGKNVVEISVVPAGKAGALRQLRTDLDVSVVAFAGDDVTDELALRTLEATDVSIRVGPGTTAAQFRVQDPAEMCQFLGFLVLQY